MKYIPHKYQEAVIEHILKNAGIGVFLGMGLGKTSTTLSAIFQAMFDELSINKVLIVAPKKVAEATWQDEAVKWDCFKNLTFSTILGTQAQRVQALAKKQISTSLIAKMSCGYLSTCGINRISTCLLSTRVQVSKTQARNGGKRCAKSGHALKRSFC